MTNERMTNEKSFTFVIRSFVIHSFVIYYDPPRFRPPILLHAFRAFAESRKRRALDSRGRGARRADRRPPRTVQYRLRLHTALVCRRRNGRRRDAAPAHQLERRTQSL